MLTGITATRAGVTPWPRHVAPSGGGGGGSSHHDGCNVASHRQDNTLREHIEGPWEDAQGPG